MSMKIAIEGMHCEACVRRVRKALERVPEAQVHIVTIGSAEVEAGASQHGAILEAIRQAGYEPHANA